MISLGLLDAKSAQVRFDFGQACRRCRFALAGAGKTGPRRFDAVRVLTPVLTVLLAVALGMALGRLV